MFACGATRLVSVGLLLVLNACQSGGVTAAPQVASSHAKATAYSAANTKSGVYLYVAVATLPSYYPSIERFRLRKGIPVKMDRTYRGYGYLIALSEDGTLYATSSRYPPVIDAFSPAGNKPVREIQVAPRCGASSYTELTAIATDQNGYVFALIYTYPESARVSGSVVSSIAPLRVPCNGVAVYAPNASGNATPVQTIRFESGAELNGLAVDANDNLYLSRNYPSEVEEFSNALVDPKRTRTFRGKYIGGVRSVATDSAGDLFIANAEQSYSDGWINRYAPSAKGRGTPTSSIFLEGSGPHVLYSIAVYGRYLYADDTAQSVELYVARKNGEQSPFYTLPASHVSSVTVGP